MNPVARQAAVELAVSVRDRTAGEPTRTVVCPPAIWLTAVAAAVGGSSVEPGMLGIGAQTMHAEGSGAYTGETSPLMLAGIAHYVILGHSERRQYDNETDAGVAAKVASALADGLIPIACIGELADERRAGLTATVIERQLRAAISRLMAIAGSGLVIAYEPVWGISDDPARNVLLAAHLPTWERLMHDWPHCRLEASGTAVGLPEGQMGNSEVGHLNLGAGFPVLQDLPRISQAIADGSFFANAVLLAAAHHAAERGGRLHILGLVGPGGIHALDDHLVAIARLAHDAGLPDDRVL